MNKAQIESTHQEITGILRSGSHAADKMQRIKDSILELLTTRTSYFEEMRQGADTISLSERYRLQSEWYRKQQSILENHHQGTGNPGWIQVNCYEDQKPNTGVNIKIYRTVPVNEYAFIQHLGKLKHLLELLSKETNDFISFKFPRGLIGFLKHPDSLVLHCTKKENIDKIADILDLWMKDNSITRGKREIGRTEIAADHSNMSFSELIASNFAYQMLIYPYNSREILRRALEKSKKSNITP